MVNHIRYAMGTDDKHTTIVCSVDKIFPFSYQVCLTTSQWTDNEPLKLIKFEHTDKKFGRNYVGAIKLFHDIIEKYHLKEETEFPKTKVK